MRFPPLVAPASALPDGETERAARQIRLPEIGADGQRRLFAARICVIGAGGLGSPVLLYLASAGIGTICIVDDDVVDTSNLQRQVLFGVADVGRPKARVAAERIRSLSPHTTVIRAHERLTSDNAERMLAGYDLVIDGSDTFDTRYAVADACDALGVPLVWGSVLRFDAQATLFWSRPPVGDPVRLRDVFPSAPPAEDVPSCADAGVLGALCGQLGALLAAEAVKLICGLGDPILGRMLVIDALSARTREVPLIPARGVAPTPPAADRVPASTGDRTIAPDELDGLGDVLLLDVREEDEFRAGSIPGALSVPLSRLREDPSMIAGEGTVVVFCQVGPRARAAAAFLRTAVPETEIVLLDGGYEAWSTRARDAAATA
ncbi:HesA/MoeB/ThiF family protein [Microbacterium sp. M28]|uniref:HesA/MoeB/ThiF family protein n=1 Tax=Microbacterium sp. M28 TaxID=2962064 RepID=UPI0021F4DFD7|nr:HesA/MoeB/ThiF family protein [Microbacterium sp. M28]UYO95887.1 HesA/MoeB/ThiF family protein [Microbacterium sp. M28]